MKVPADDRKLLQEKAFEVFHVKHQLDAAMTELRVLELQITERNGCFGKNFTHDYAEFVDPDADQGGSSQG